MYTLICYVSPDLKSSISSEIPFCSDLGVIKGKQTNEAPTIYAIKKLYNEGKRLDRIIAIITKESGYDTYKRRVEGFCSQNGLVAPFFDNDIFMETTASSADMLKEIIKKLTPDDRIIIETTGGPRTAVTTLTLLSRFLHRTGKHVVFSTYADYDKDNCKGVITVTQDHQLFDLLEATSVFLSTGNTDKIKEACSGLDIPNIDEFLTAPIDFINSILVCNTSTVEDNAKKLKKAIIDMEIMEYNETTANAVIFRYILVNEIKEKMSFINCTHKYPIIDIARWCINNGYLQQAVTIINEKIVHLKDKCDRQVNLLEEYDLHAVQCLRNSINHAAGRAYVDNRKTPVQYRERIKVEIDSMLCDPDKIEAFLNIKLDTISKILNII